MDTGIYYIVMGVIMVASFLLGKYVWPNAKNEFYNILTRYPSLIQWGIAACQYLQQYYSNEEGQKKNELAASMIQSVASSSGLELTEDQAKTLAQAAYDEWKRGVSESTTEK